MIALGLCWRSPVGGVCVAAAIGFATDLLSGSLLGQHALLRLAAYAAARVGSRHLNLRGALPQVAFVAGLTAANALALALLTSFFSPGSGAGIVAVRELLPQALANAALRPARRVRHRTRGRRGSATKTAASACCRSRRAGASHDEVDDTTRGRLGAGVDASVEDRLPLLVVVILLVFGAFIVRLFQLQIIMGEVFAEESDKNSVRLVRLEAPRGDILDREGRVIATTRPAFGLQVLPNDLRNPELAFRALGQLLGEDADRLREQVGDAARARALPARAAGRRSLVRPARERRVAPLRAAGRDDRRAPAPRLRGRRARRAPARLSGRDPARRSSRRATTPATARAT